MAPFSAPTARIALSTCADETEPRATGHAANRAVMVATRRSSRADRGALALEPPRGSLLPPWGALVSMGCALCGAAGAGRAERASAVVGAMERRRFSSLIIGMAPPEASALFKGVVLVLLLCWRWFLMFLSTVQQPVGLRIADSDFWPRGRSGHCPTSTI